MNNIELPKFKDYTNQKVNFIQPKLDGHFAKIVRHNSGLFTATSKNGKDITYKLMEIGHIKDELNLMPFGSCILAELHCPGVFATDVPTMLNNADEKLLLTAFAAPWWAGKDASGMHLELVIMQLKELGFSVAHVICVYSPFVDEKGKEALLELAVSNKFEGYVLKESHMTGWYKLKPVKLIDIFVTGTHQSFSSLHYGGLKSIRAAAYDKNGKIHDLGNVGGGFDKEHRQLYNTQEKRDALIGEVCEVKCDCLAANGKLRFPRIAKNEDGSLKWRTDKDPKQCTMEQFE